MYTCVYVCVCIRWTSQFVGRAVKERYGAINWRSGDSVRSLEVVHSIYVNIHRLYTCMCVYRCIGREVCVPVRRRNHRRRRSSGRSKKRRFGSIAGNAQCPSPTRRKPWLFLSGTKCHCAKHEAYRRGRTRRFCPGKEKERGGQPELYPVKKNSTHWNNTTCTHINAYMHAYMQANMQAWVNPVCMQVCIYMCICCVGL